jgi:acyl carrier protein
MTEQQPQAAVPDLALEREVAEMIVTALNLDVQADAIGAEDALYGDDGLGLDSIDILEVALVVSKRFGFQLKADSDDNFRIFGSLRSLALYIATHRTK